MRRRTFHRLKLSRTLWRTFILICCLFIFLQYFSIKLITWTYIPAPISTRLYPDMPLTIDLRSYSVCHPNELYLTNVTSHYHRTYTNKQQEVCFLIEHLDGGPWWSYVTHEFAEILTYLNEIGLQSNITYRRFPDQIKLNYETDLRKYFLNACDMDENIPIESQKVIVILIWDINRLLWYKMRPQWEYLLNTTRIRLTVFIDDLHYETKQVFSSRQYLFQSVASEIFSTYPYLFHNYYSNISPTKITWLPHAASTLSYRSINKSAKNVLFVSGAAMFDWYPCRTRAFTLCQSRGDLVSCLRHPGYGEAMKTESSFFYGGERYFNYMRQFVFGLGTCQSVHYAIAKLFELPANGLALVTTNDLKPILERLHLYHNEHFLMVDCSSVGKLPNEIIRIQNIPKENIFQIRKKSQEIIYERHLTKHRAELLHVRLLSQALIVASTSHEERMQWERWGRSCY